MSELLHFSTSQLSELTTEASELHSTISCQLSELNSVTVGTTLHFATSQLLNFILLYCSHLSYTSLYIQSTVGVDYKAVGATLHSSKPSQLSGFTTVAIWATTHSILSEFPLALAQTMASAGNKAKCLPSVNYSTKPIQQLSELIIVPVGATSSFN